MCPQPIWFQKTSALNRVKLILVFTASQLPRTKLIHSSPTSNGPFCHRQVWFYFLSVNPPCEVFAFHGNQLEYNGSQGANGAG